MNIEKKNIPKGECPYCFHVVDSSSCVDKHGAQPKPGDVTVCIRCGGIIKFDERLEHVQMNEEEQREAFQEFPELPALIRAIKEMPRGEDNLPPSR